MTHAPEQYDAEPVKLPRLGTIALAAAAYWIVFVGLAITYWMLQHTHKYLLSMFLQDTGLVIVGTFFSVLLTSALRKITHFEFRWQMAIAAGLALAVAVPFEAAFRTVIYIVGTGGGIDKVSAKVIFVGGLFWLAPLGLWASMNLALFHASEARSKERRLAALQIEAHEAKVRALRYQINPHFLYNTLNSIAALILDRRNDMAEEMVLRLSAFFRASLTIDPLKDVTLGEEVSIQLRYLDVEQLRFEDSLLVEIDVPPEVEDAQVPSLILQPLVENALKHGAREPGHPMRLRISARRDDSFVQIEVSDNGPGRPIQALSTGVGLKNVAHRLSSRFGARSRLDAFPQADGFMVRLRFPYQLA